MEYETETETETAIQKGESSLDRVETGSNPRNILERERRNVCSFASWRFSFLHGSNRETVSTERRDERSARPAGDASSAAEPTNDDGVDDWLSDD